MVNVLKGPVKAREGLPTPREVLFLNVCVTYAANVFWSFHDYAIGSGGEEGGIFETTKVMTYEMSQKRQPRDKIFSSSLCLTKYQRLRIRRMS